MEPDIPPQPQQRLFRRRGAQRQHQRETRRGGHVLGFGGQYLVQQAAPETQIVIRQAG